MKLFAIVVGHNKTESEKRSYLCQPLSLLDFYNKYGTFILLCLTSALSLGDGILYPLINSVFCYWFDLPII